jgi:hypothetical protein
MADGVFTATKTMWGYACSVTGGTAATITTLTTDPVKLKGIVVVGEATTDIMILNDGAGQLIAKAACGVKSASPVAIPLWGARAQGLKITHGGATSTGFMSIFLE